MKTVNYIISGIFAVIAILCMVAVFCGAYHQAILFCVASLMAFVFFCEARKDGK